MSREAVEFAVHCMVLQHELDELLHKEPSVRVRIAVLMHKMTEICHSQEDVKSCLEDVIEAFQIERDSLDEGDCV